MKIGEAVPCKNAINSEIQKNMKKLEAQLKGRKPTVVDVIPSVLTGRAHEYTCSSCKKTFLATSAKNVMDCYFCLFQKTAKRK